MCIRDRLLGHNFKVSGHFLNLNGAVVGFCDRCKKLKVVDKNNIGLVAPHLGLYLLNGNGRGFVNKNLSIVKLSGGGGYSVPLVGSKAALSQPVNSCLLYTSTFARRLKT